MLGRVGRMGFTIFQATQTTQSTHFTPNDTNATIDPNDPNKKGHPLVTKIDFRQDYTTLGKKRGRWVVLYVRPIGLVLASGSRIRLQINFYLSKYLLSKYAKR